MGPAASAGLRRRRRRLLQAGVGGSLGRWGGVQGGGNGKEKRGGVRTGGWNGGRTRPPERGEEVWAREIFAAKTHAAVGLGLVLGPQAVASVAEGTLRCPQPERRRGGDGSCDSLGCILVIRVGGGL